ncbi:MAG TPA: hypothetical protein VFQ18_07460 [Candidatus Acidoferrum sp.]|nr:hypothetical protein [Candidatus Acidoferrum sp.]
MKINAIHLASFLLLGMLSPIGHAQDKPKSEEKPKAEVQTTPVKVQIVFTEYDAEKKVKSLPYTIYVNAPDASELKPGWTKLRIGSRVPVSIGKDQVQYFDVGTNIDARGAYTGGGRFLLFLNLERSWVEGEVALSAAKSDSSQPDTASSHFREPIVRQFKSELDLKVREGQPVESTMATDPVSGKVLKVEVSVAIVK